MRQKWIISSEKNCNLIFDNGFAFLEMQVVDNHLRDFKKSISDIFERSLVLIGIIQDRFTIRMSKTIFMLITELH